uniref:Uncharacterized protein n=1 Tax=Daucus carota subsp. sativus TaxID=79200 RepID=A0A161WUK8_DAUCS
MATNDSQKQFLTLIRGFASESSQGERRIVDLKKRIDELRYEIVGANAELEEAKCAKESIEQDIKGYEVEMAMNEASIQTLEVLLPDNPTFQARVGLIQNEVAAAKSELEALKYPEDAEVSRRSLEETLAQIVSQTIVEEQKYQAELNIHKQLAIRVVELHADPAGVDSIGRKVSPNGDFT